MNGQIKKRVRIKFSMKLSKSATKTLEMLHEAFGEHSLSQTAVFEWHSCFKAGRVSLENVESSGRSSTSKTTENVEKIRELIHEDRRRTIHEESEETKGKQKWKRCREIDVTGKSIIRRIHVKQYLGVSA
jgi:hypothetical protein